MHFSAVHVQNIDIARTGHRRVEDVAGTGAGLIQGGQSGSGVAAACLRIDWHNLTHLAVASLAVTAWPNGPMHNIVSFQIRLDAR